MLTEKYLDKIYQSRKSDLLLDLTPQKNPIAFILGGQPASGKSNLANIITKQNLDRNFLYINGDIYREYHPQFSELKQSSDLFSQETQVFSNYFTEKLIEEALKNKYNIIVEGTMRNPQIPLQTALKFKNEGFRVEAFAISAPAIFTELGLYTRYQEEINYQGWGRLADLKSHNSAVNGLPFSLDLLYNKKAVDAINLYSYQGKKHIETFALVNDKWDIKILPSIYIEETRQLQLEKIEDLKNIIDRGKITYREIDTILKGKIDIILSQLEKIQHDIERDNRKGFKR